MEERNLLEQYPILVNENMEIIDGQHRLAAAIRLDIPVHYQILENASLGDVVGINSSQKNWTMMDYIESYIRLGNQNYVILKNFMEEFGIGGSMAAALLVGSENLRGGNKYIKRGTLVVRQEGRARSVAAELVELEKYADDFSTRSERELAQALLRLRANKAFDFERLVNKLKVHGIRLERRASVKYYILQLEEIYNHNAKADKARVDLYVSSQL